MIARAESVLPKLSPNEGSYCAGGAEGAQCTDSGKPASGIVWETQYRTD